MHGKMKLMWSTQPTSYLFIGVEVDNHHFADSEVSFVYREPAMS